MTVQALKSAAARITDLHAAAAVKAAAKAPVKFAVFFKGRGNTSKDKSAASQGSLDRAQAIALVASVVEEAVKSCGGTVLVDLKKPQVVMSVEVLPLTTSSICALCWLPQSLLSGTTKLTVKPLVAHAGIKAA